MDPSRPARNVFISYSHNDSRFVEPIVKILRAVNAYVFLDRDTIPPGKEWAKAIAAAIESADLLAVFWCDHAAKSDMVRGEYLTAQNGGKDLLPLLLDATPLTPDLQRYQWIDLSRAIAHVERSAWTSSSGAIPHKGGEAQVIKVRVLDPPSHESATEAAFTILKGISTKLGEPVRP